MSEENGDGDLSEATPEPINHPPPLTSIESTENTSDLESTKKLDKQKG